MSAQPHQQSLLKRGKRALSVQLKTEFNLPSGRKQLDDLLSYLLDPCKPLDYESADWCKWLIAGGVPFNEFANTVRYYDNASVCGLVWTANFIAYRCRTCGVSPCMSLCPDCFYGGNHEGHDFNMFKSHAGGACDCGDGNVMKCEGFCTKHGRKHASAQVTIPRDIIGIAQVAVPRLIVRLVYYLREKYLESVGVDSANLDDSEHFLNLLHELNSTGSAMWDIVSSSLSDPDLYAGTTEVNSPSSACKVNNVEALRSALASAHPEPGPVSYCLRGNIIETEAPQHSTVLAEITFWMVKYEFPEKLTTWLLGMLPNEKFKMAFTEAFVDHYSMVSRSLIACIGNEARQRFANKVVHVSVQLFSNETYAIRMVESRRLLHVMVASLHSMLAGCLIQSGMHAISGLNTHYVLDCSLDVIRDHCFWPLISDLVNVLSHRVVAEKFLSDEQLLRLWFEILSFLQGMNLNERELNHHIEFEVNVYYTAFSAEFEIGCSPLWRILMHASQPRHLASVLVEAKAALDAWFDDVGLSFCTVPSRHQVSFHLPLHRYFAAFLCHVIKIKAPISVDALLEPGFLKRLMIQPLHLQVAIAEINAHMWVRNGLQIQGQVMTYVQSHFCNSLVDLDLYLLQLCCTHLDVGFFVRSVIERFHVVHWMSLRCDAPLLDESAGDASQDAAIIEGCLVTLTRTLTARANIGLTSAEVLRKELVALLCLSDRTYSQLCDAVPDKSGMASAPSDLEVHLKEIADFKAPGFDLSGKLQQGTYSLKSSVWANEFDPLYAMLRTVHRREFQGAMDRYAEQMVRLGKALPGESLWPPFHLPPRPADAYLGILRLLKAKALLALIFCILFKRVHNRAVSSDNKPTTTSDSRSPASGAGPAVSDGVLCFVIYILHLVVTELSVTTATIMCKGESRGYQEWFPHEDLARNLVHVIATVKTDNAFTSIAADVSVGDCIEMEDEASNELLMDTSEPTRGGGSAGINAPLQGAAREGLLSGSANEAVSRLAAKDANAVYVGESLLSLLMKIYESLRISDEAHFESTAAASSSRSVRDGTSNEGRVGSGRFYVGQLLELMRAKSRLCAAAIDVHQRSQSAGHSSMSVSEDDSLAARRRKAKERQQRVMEKMARQQCKFMRDNAAVIGDVNAAGDSVFAPVEASSRIPDSPEDKARARVETHECSICASSSTSTYERPMGLVVHTQPSSVLSYMRDSFNTCCLPVQDLMPGLNKNSLYEAYYEGRKELITGYCLSPHAYLQALGISSKYGVYVQSCGHSLHLDCHRSYLESLESHSMLRLSLGNGEYLCPMCRQLANAILPLPPSTPAAAVAPAAVTASLSAPERAVHEVKEMLASLPPYQMPKPSAYSRAVDHFWSDLSMSSFPSECLQLSHNGGSTFHLLAAVARSNLEFSNLYRKRSIVVQPRCSALGPLIHALNTKARNDNAAFAELSNYSRPAVETWAQLTGLKVSGSADAESSVVLAKRMLPLLVREPAVVLLELILSMPLPLQTDHFDCIVKAVYWLAYVRAAVSVSCKLSHGERSAWLKDGGRATTQEQPLIAEVITQLKDSPLYSDDSSMESFLHSVWSPQSIEAAIQDGCLSFLELAAHLKKHLYHVDIPEIMNEQAYMVICKFLNLVPSTAGDNAKSSVATATTSGKTLHCLDADVGGGASSNRLVASWCQSLKLMTRTSTKTARALATFVTSWHSPCLMTLPCEYDTIFQYYRKKTCPKCHVMPSLPSVCLVCGQFVCFKELCCVDTGGVAHSKVCGSGTCILLDINRSAVVIIRGPRATLWGSVYLDKHGEEDRDLVRGKPLYLCHLRYRMLEEQWLSHNFDFVCKRWMLHTNDL